MAGKAVSEVLVTNHSNYQIFPFEPKPIEEIKYGLKDVEGIGGGSGCLVWGSIFGVVVLIIGYWYCGPGFNCGPNDNSLVEPISGFSGLLFATVGTIAVHFLLKQKNLSKRELEQKNEAERNEKLRVEKEAASMTSKLRDIYESSPSLRVELREHLRTASEWLGHAEREYGESAYAPFWDAIEDAG